jgi:cyclopropane-fatty-acyl-phospholipid synthase
MSFTTIDSSADHEASILKASPDVLRKLSGIPASFRLAGMMVLRARRGTIRFDLPDGRKVLFDHGIKGPNAIVEVHNFNFAKRAMAGGDIGFAESYMDQEWSTPHLTAVLEFFSENFEAAAI